MQATYYRGNIDGDIKEYLIQSHYNGIVCQTFCGYEPFEQLWDIGIIIPQITYIRLMFNIFRGDEHYTIL